MQADCTGANPGLFAPFPTPLQKPSPHAKSWFVHTNEPQQKFVLPGGAVHRGLGLSTLTRGPLGMQRQPSSPEGGRLRSKPSLVLGNNGFGSVAASLSFEHQKFMLWGQSYCQIDQYESRQLEESIKALEDSLAGKRCGVLACARIDTAAACSCTRIISCILGGAGESWDHRYARVVASGLKSAPLVKVSIRVEVLEGHLLQPCLSCSRRRRRRLRQGAHNRDAYRDEAAPAVGVREHPCELRRQRRLRTVFGGREGHGVEGSRLSCQST